MKRSGNSFEQYFINEIENRGTRVLPTEKFFTNGKRKTLNIFNIFNNIYNAKKKKYFDVFDTVIVFDNILIAIPLSLYLPKKRIINWRWNIYDKKIRMFCLSLLKNLEIWTFDEEDAKKFGMNLNTQFFFKDLNFANFDKNKIDLFFIGYDKNRYSYLSDIKSFCCEQNIRYSFHILPDKKAEYKKSDSDIIEEKFWDYEKILETVSCSKAILDLTQDNQVGLTLRTLEAIYFDKKIVTNNKNLQNMDFFSPDNVFIIGERDISGLSQFINGKKAYYTDEVKQFYDYNSWLKRFHNK